MKLSVYSVTKIEGMSGDKILHVYMICSTWKCVNFSWTCDYAISAYCRQVLASECYEELPAVVLASRTQEDAQVCRVCVQQWWCAVSLYALLAQSALHSPADYVEYVIKQGAMLPTITERQKMIQKVEGLRKHFLRLIYDISQNCDQSAAASRFWPQWKKINKIGNIACTIFHCFYPRTCFRNPHSSITDSKFACERQNCRLLK